LFQYRKQEVFLAGVYSDSSHCFFLSQHNMKLVPALICLNHKQPQPH
jgi:hypothetical protein